MFASPFPANGSNSSSSTSFGHTATSSATSSSQVPSTAALGRATEQLTLHDNTMSAPVASTSGTRGGIGTTNGEANGGGGGKQPRKRGRKRIEEDLTQIKGNDSLDADAKRKLQNRAAQRAFRERKEKHVSDLEARVQIQEQQLLEYSEVIRSLIAENEALRRGEHPPSTVLPASFGLGSFRSNASSASTASPPGHPSTYPAHSHSPEDVKPVIPRESHAPTLPAPVAANLPSALQSTSLPPVTSSSFLPQGAPTKYASSFTRDLSPHAAGNPPPPQPPQANVPSRQPSPIPPPAPPVPMPLPPLNDVDMSFDFDAPFNFDDTTLPPLFTTMIDELLAAPPSSSNDPSLPVSSTSASDAPDPSDDVCELDDSDELPPLPMGRIPCDKPECDFTAQSCLLPIPWRPPMAIGTDKDLWVAQKCWAKLVSHPLFGQCDSDELCQELRDKTRCSDDGRLVVPKSDVCDIFRSIPAKARLRQAQVAMQ